MSTRGAALFEERDYNHATDNTYKQLRAEASRYQNKRAALSKQSQQAYQRGDKLQAHELSQQAKAMLQKAIDADRKAAEYVFKENNADSADDEIDLHGLYVVEAEWILQTRLAQCARTNQSQLKVIVGKGLHSANGVAKLKPAVDSLCAKSGLSHHIDPKNLGVMVIDLATSGGASVPHEWHQQLYQPPLSQYHPLSHQPLSHQPLSHQPLSQYQAHQQPLYQQQPLHQQQSLQINTGNSLVDSLLKMFCACINK